MCALSVVVFYTVFDPKFNLGVMLNLSNQISGTN
jgi:hypothetical protein